MYSQFYQIFYKQHIVLLFQTLSLLFQRLLHLHRRPEKLRLCHIPLPSLKLIRKHCTLLLKGICKKCGYLDIFQYLYRLQLIRLYQC